MNHASSEVVLARLTHNSVPVRVTSGFRGTVFHLLDGFGGAVASYISAGAVIAALHGEGERHPLTFEGYFGEAASEIDLVPPGGGVLDLFGASQPVAGLTVAREAAVPAPRPKAQAAFTVAAPAKSEPELGIDLAKRGHEVRKLFFAGFGHWVTRSGYDPEDVLQEIYRGILARNRGRCPFDVRKSSFGHYVHLVANCVLSNYHRREARRREVEQVGMPAPASMREEAEAHGGTVDAASVADRLLVVHRDHWSHPEGDDATGDAIRRLSDHLRRKAEAGVAVDPLEAQVAGMLSAGLSRREIAQKVGVSQGRVVNVITSLREHASDWL